MCNVDLSPCECSLNEVHTSTKEEERMQAIFLMFVLPKEGRSTTPDTKKPPNHKGGNHKPQAAGMNDASPVNLYDSDSVRFSVLRYSDSSTQNIVRINKYISVTYTSRLLRVIHYLCLQIELFVLSQRADNLHLLPATRQTIDAQQSSHHSESYSIEFDRQIIIVSLRSSLHKQLQQARSQWEVLSRKLKRDIGRTVSYRIYSPPALLHPRSCSPQQQHDARKLLLLQHRRRHHFRETLLRKPLKPRLPTETLVPTNQLRWTANAS
jgi:hypothetical protein